MQVKNGPKEKVTLDNRRSWGRLDEQTKAKILKEIQSGLIGQREASRRYAIPRGTIVKWQNKRKLVILLHEKTSSAPENMNDGQQTKALLIQVQKLTKALEYEKLKNVALETMIEVAESDLHIKIRKKRGTKQSSE